MQENRAISYFSFLQPYTAFIGLLFFFWSIALAFSLIFTQAELFLAVNRHHHPDADLFFMLFTYIGDWPFTLLLAIIFLFIRLRNSLVLIGTMLYTGLYTHSLKFLLHHPRPALYFEHLDPIYTIKDYALRNSLSFPSGHTTCVFALCITLCYILRTKNQIGLFFLALLVSFSRVYLSQHFFKDLMAGSLIGTFFALHLLWLFEKRDWYYHPALNNSIISLIKRNKPVS